MREYVFSSMAEFKELRERIRQDLYEVCLETAEPLYIALNEAVNNAVFHGNSGNSRNSERCIKVNLFKNTEQVCIVVRDEGPGFNHKEYIDNNDIDMQEHGRGLEIIRFCTDFVTFNDAGNEIIMGKNIA